MSQAYLGDPAAYQIKLRREREATPAKVQAAAKRWLSDGEYVAEVFPFGDPQASTAAVDRNQPPTTGQPPELRLPKLERTTLSGGLKVVLAERHEIPLVNFSLLVDSGYAADQFAGPGTAALVSKLLDQGTKTRTSLEIGEQLAQLGANLSVSANMDGIDARLSALKANLDGSLEIFADVALNQSFPQADFLREQKQQLAAIEREKTEPVPLALRVMPGLIYGKGHAYSEPWTGSGNAASVSQLTREDMARFHAAWFKPNHATLIVVGDTTLAEMRPKLEKLFSAWTPGETPRKNVATVALPERSVVYLMDRPGAQQSLILAGNVAPPRNNPDEVSIESMNDILGGDFGGRLNMNLREDKHWAYGALTMLMSARGQRPFLAYAPVQTDKTKESMAEIDKELRGILADRPATGAELARVKASETLRLPGSRETMDSVRSSIEDLVAYDLPEDYYQTYAGKVRALTLADIEKSAQEVVQPKHLIWVVVGDRAKIEAGIRELGLGEVRVLNPE
jgi:zinc protease